MIFTLSLPVPRRQWLAVRAGLGLLTTGAIIAIVLAIPPLITTFQSAHISWLWALQSAPFLFLGSAVFYMFAVYLEAAHNENRRMGSSLLMFLCVLAQLTLHDRFSIFPFMAGYQATLTGILACLILCGGLYLAAVTALDRREF